MPKRSMTRRVLPEAQLARGAAARMPGAQAPKEVAFSVRLTAEEHELLRQAAAARGWTPTTLIRTATLERAKHILNTSRITTFNFKGLAVRIAEQLFTPRTYAVKWVLADPEHFERTERLRASQMQHFSNDDDELVRSVTPDQEEFPVEAVAELRKAVRYGGGEFLNQVLEYCESLTASQRSDVPSPIEPGSPSN